MALEQSLREGRSILAGVKNEAAPARDWDSVSHAADNLRKNTIGGLLKGARNEDVGEVLDGIVSGAHALTIAADAIGDQKLRALLMDVQRVAIAARDA